MGPSVTGVFFKLQKPAALSLKQFMMRSEILKLYRGFMRLGKMLNEPPPDLPRPDCTNNANVNNNHNPIRDEWTRWVRAEFRLRVNASTTDEEVTRTLLVHGKRQLQEMERTIMLATNRNTSSVRPPPSPPTSKCPSQSGGGKETSNKNRRKNVTNSQIDGSIAKSESGESSL